MRIVQTGPKVPGLNEKGGRLVNAPALKGLTDLQIMELELLKQEELETVKKIALK